MTTSNEDKTIDTSLLATQRVIISSGFMSLLSAMREPHPFDQETAENYMTCLEIISETYKSEA